MSTLVKKLLDDILSMSIHNAHCIMQSVVFNIVEQVMVYLLRLKVIGETLDAQLAKFFDAFAAAERVSVSKRLLALSLFIAHFATFLGVKCIQKWKRRSRVPPLRQRRGWIQYKRSKGKKSHCQAAPMPEVTEYPVAVVEMLLGRPH